MDLFLIDAIGPFFRGFHKGKVNWSKISFLHLDTLTDEDWQGVEQDLRCFAGRVKDQGYNAVSLDDVAHLAQHPLHEAEVALRVRTFRERMVPLIRMLTGEYGLRVFLTSDVLPLSPALDEILDGDHRAMEVYFRQLLVRLLDDLPELAGVILRVGESDGTDVKDPLHTRLHVRCPDELNEMLHDLLPAFEERNKTLILRTWTVGAHPVGDLMWNAETIDRVLEGIDSENLIVSMKHGESDFFRYLPLNPLLFEPRCKVLLEVQARREYEGGGLYPSYLGRECERWAGELAGCKHVVGVSVWCQTGGWHRFHRMAFLAEDGSDVWIRINTAVVIAVFRYGRPARDGVAKVVGEEWTDRALSLLADAEEAIENILYVPSYAKRALYFRRVRIPPLFHVYWDTVFINPGVRSLLGVFVSDPAAELQVAERALAKFPRMIALAGETGLPVDDIEQMRDLMEILVLGRRYFLGGGDPEAKEAIVRAKQQYKRQWPKRHRYRIRLSLEGNGVPHPVVGMAERLLLRRQREYRVTDRWFFLPLLGAVYHSLRRCSPDALPKFLRKSAMGLDVVLK